MTEAPVGAGRRRTELRRQRRRQRRRLTAAALAVLALVVVLVTVYVARREPPMPAPPPVATGTAQPTSAQPVRVRIYNGVGTPQLAERVRARLVAAGLVYLPGGNAPRFGVARTEIQVGDATPEALARGARVAQVLGVPVSAVHASRPTPVADVVVVVGADFVPR